MPIGAAARRRVTAAPTPAYKSWDSGTRTVSNNGACNERLDCDIYAYRDGSVDERHENYGSSSQVQFDTYCTVVPTTDFGDDYHIKLTPQSGSSWYDATGSDSLSTWHALTSDRVWHFDFQDCSSLATQVYDLEISDDGGSTTLDTIAVTLSMDHDTP